MKIFEGALNAKNCKVKLQNSRIPSPQALQFPTFARRCQLDAIGCESSVSCPGLKKHRFLLGKGSKWFKDVWSIRIETRWTQLSRSAWILMDPDGIQYERFTRWESLHMWLVFSLTENDQKLMHQWPFWESEIRSWNRCPWMWLNICFKDPHQSLSTSPRNKDHMLKLQSHWCDTRQLMNMPQHAATFT